MNESQPGAYSPKPNVWSTYKNSTLSALRNWKVLRGRASRSEFWWWSLTFFIASYVFPAAAALVDASLAAVGLPFPVLSIAVFFVMLAGIVPSLTVSVRRMHDAGCSPAWAWATFASWILLSTVGVAAVLYMFATLFTGDTSMVLLAAVFVLVLLVSALVISIIFVVKAAKPSVPRDNEFGPAPAS